MKIRLAVMSFLQFAVWGAYLTSMGTFLGKNGFEENIGTFYATQGIVSLFFPAVMGMVADRFIQAQRLYMICHVLSAAAMIGMWYFGSRTEINVPGLYTCFFLGIGFYMASLSLSYSVAYNAMERAGMDIVKEFPPIRVWGTIGFIAIMWIVDVSGFQDKAEQFLVSGILGLVLAVYVNAVPKCEIKVSKEKKTFAERLGLNAFKLFADRKMAVFFVFSMLLGVALPITNSYANPFITGFENIKEFENAFAVRHANILISVSQISETLCILLIPFCLKRLGIKKVMLIAMSAWTLRFLFFGLGNPGGGLWLFVLSGVVYGVAFDFFNISGSLFVEKETGTEIRSSAQGLFILMCNGIGATLGTLAAQKTVNANVFSQTEPLSVWAGWQTVWFIFAAYAAVLAILFALLFKYKHRAG